jgi:hypothetical protein
MDPQVYIFRDAKPASTLADAINYISGVAPDDYGCIWLRHDNGTQLAIMIKGQQAYPHFFPRDDHPGWQVAAPEAGDWDTSVTFHADNGELTPMPLALVLPTERTLEILRYFWHHGERSPAEQWTSLVDGEP